MEEYADFFFFSFFFFCLSVYLGTLMPTIMVSTTKEEWEWVFGSQGERWGRQTILSEAHSWDWRAGFG